MTRKWLASLGMIILVAALWGCGSNGGGGGSGVPSTTGTPSAVGSSACEGCHGWIVAPQGWDGSVHDTAAAGCEGCHGNGQFHQAGGGNPAIPDPEPGVEECDTCHATLSPGFLTRHLGDDPATSYVTTPNAPTVEGYVFAECRECHTSLTVANPTTAAFAHDPGPTDIHKQWAQSAHAGKIASASPDTESVWGHYDWDDTASRGSCQRCHTATGIKNFFDLTRDGDPATNYAANGSGNDFSHLEGWTATNKRSNQNELLYCWGCHSDVATGALRNPGAITEAYAAVNQSVSSTNVVADTGTDVTETYPNIGPSNVCMGCHLGREVGANIAAVTASDGILSFVNSHYLTAGATIFNRSGYEYAVYPDFGYHQNVGVLNDQGTGTDGPCVTCHMTSAEPHKFEVVTKDGAGAITAVATTRCGNCHAGMTPATLEEEKETFHLAMEELKAALAARGIFFAPSNPYFFKDSNGNGILEPGEIARTNAFIDWQSVATAIGTANPAAAPVDWRDVMGAAFNYNLLEHDPGAYAHNRQYALKLIADSIDFLQDGMVDQSLSAADGSKLTSVAAALFNQINVGTVDSSASPVHANAVANASAGYCGGCHGQGPHYGGAWIDGDDNPNNRAQFMGYSGAWGASAFNLPIVCGSCHAGDNIGANALILDQYAESGHGDVTAIPWTVPEAGGSCQRCHTSWGFVNNLAGNASASLTAGAQVDGYRAAMQVLVCTACHSDVNGGVLRAAGAFTATWTQNNITAVVSYPNVGASNLCVRCHSARRAGPNISDTATTTAHYLPVAASVFGGTANLIDITANTSGSGPAVGTKFTGVGYEFAGQNYAGLGEHKNIDAGGASGPCAVCHMSGAAGHSWEPAERDAAGNYTAVTSSACTGCHTDMDAAHLNASKAAFQLALDELDATLQAKGFFFNKDNGRFYQDAGFTLAVTAGAGGYYETRAIALGLDTGDLEGAAFNLWLYAYSGGDPCGFIHNRTYALNLIADSVDYLADGVLDGDVSVAQTQLGASYQ